MIDNFTDMKKPVLIAAMTAAIALAAGCSGGKQTTYAQTEEISVAAANFLPGKAMTAPRDSSTLLSFILDNRECIPFNQSAIHVNPDVVKLAPDAEKPFFDVQIALPMPSAYTENREGWRQDQGELVGLERGVYWHNHSPGFEILPNGDALAIYFSTKAYFAEKDTSTTFIQSRQRFGSLEWDMPEVFFKTDRYNDQSGLLWTDGGKVWFFGGGRNISDWVPFRIATSEDCGATWTFTIPQLDKAAEKYEAQPITSAFRAPDGKIYMASDGDGSNSFLWMSSDEGLHWHDQGGRTGGRHSAIVPLDDKGTLLSLGGKNSNVDGWTPANTSTDWGVTWSESKAAPFPPLGSAQRPSLIRLQSGTLLFVSDAYLIKYNIYPPEAWGKPFEPFAAFSTDNGKTWHFKTFPIGVPHHSFTRHEHNSLGYTTVRQAPNGTIHVLTSANANNLHYEFNEAWLWSEEPTVWQPVTAIEGGEVKEYKEYWKDAKGRLTKALKSVYSGRTCPDGRFLLDGEVKDYYQDGILQYEAVYTLGRKTGNEKFYAPDGTLRWSWERDLAANKGVWTQYRPDGKKKLESTWTLLSKARDRETCFIGYVANGPATHWDAEGNVCGKFMFTAGIGEKIEE